MSKDDQYEFNTVIKHIIKKSLFTEKQIQIILRKMERSGVGFGLSRGAYYRQLGQTRTKLARLYYTMSLLEGLGVIGPRDVDVMSKLSEQVKALKERDIFHEHEQDIITIFERAVAQACKL